MRVELINETPFSITCKITDSSGKEFWRKWELLANGVGVYDEKGLIEVLMPLENLEEQIKREIKHFIESYEIYDNIEIKLPWPWKDRNLVKVIRSYYIESLALEKPPTSIWTLLEELQKRGLTIVLNNVKIMLTLDIENGTWILENIIVNDKIFRNYIELSEYVYRETFRIGFNEILCPICGTAFKVPEIYAHVMKHLIAISLTINDHATFFSQASVNSA